MTEVKLHYPIVFDFGESNKLIGKTDDIFKEHFNSNIIFNYYRPGRVKIQIFYKQNYLFDNLKILLNNNIDLLSGISVAKNKFGQPGSNIDFTDSKLLDFNDGGGHWENGFKFVILEIDKISVVENFKIGIDGGEFYLCENAMLPLGMNYKVEAFHFDKPNKFEAKNEFDGFYNFGEIKFKLEFQFEETMYTKFKTTFRRIPILTVDDNEKLDSNSIIQYANILCILLSFYYDRNINFFRAQIRQPEDTITFIRQISYQINDDMDFPLLKKYKSFVEFISICNYKSTSANYEFLEVLISKFIISKNFDIESEFMILYGLLEKIRNYFLNKTKEIADSIEVKEEFEFCLSKTKTQHYIKDKLKKISNIVVDTDKQEYLDTVSMKVNCVKRILMKNQFESFFNYFNINLLKDYELEMKEVLKFRNKVYHGSSSQKHLVEIKNLKPKMRNLVSDLILIIIE